MRVFKPTDSWWAVPPACLLGLAATAVATGPTAAQEVRVRVQAEADDENEVQVQVEGGGQAQIQLRIGGAPVPVRAATSRPADVTAALTVKQEQPGGPAVFTLALPVDTKGGLAEAPAVTTYYGTVAVAPKPADKHTWRFTWDVASARKAAPALRGTEMRVAWNLVPPAGEDGEGQTPTQYITTAHVTIGADGAVEVADVQTRPVIIAAPNPAAALFRAVYQFARTTRDLSFRAIRLPGAGVTQMSVELKGGRVFTKQPEVKVSVGRLAGRRKWNPKAKNTADTITWMPPKKLPKKNTTGTITWTWTSQAPGGGEGKSVVTTVSVRVTPAGLLTVTGMNTKSAATKDGARPATTTKPTG